MKTAKTTGLGFILVLLVCFTVICGCKEVGSGGNDVNATHALGTFPGLDAKTEKRILQEFFKTYVKPDIPEATVNDFWVEGYFGTYNGVVIVMFGDSLGGEALGSIKGDVIAGLPFWDSPARSDLYAWKNGFFYRLQDAYNSGLLTDDDVKSIHKVFFAHWTDDEYADYFIGRTFHSLDAETEKRILQEFFKTYVDIDIIPEATVNDFWIQEYYGTYNGVVAVRFGDPFRPGHDGGIKEDDIAFLPFYYSTIRNSYYAWKNGVLYRLRDAYNSGLLTDDDVEDIHRGSFAHWTTDMYASYFFRTFPRLDVETQKWIVQDFFDTYIKPDITGVTVNDIRLEKYYGTYNGVVVVKFSNSLYLGVFLEEVIAGLQFSYFTFGPILAWENGVLYRLQDAYDSRLLTDDDVKDIHRKKFLHMTDDEYADFIGG
jgi:Ca2+-binding EF-hand superfamily protein